MKFDILHFTKNLTDSMRSAGYHFEGVDQKTKEVKFYRSLSANLFPRFHIYAMLGNGQKLTVSFHLDQKAPVYSGSPAHGGDYEGEVLDKEAARLKTFFIDTSKLPQLDSDSDL